MQSGCKISSIAGTSGAGGLLKIARSRRRTAAGRYAVASAVIMMAALVIGAPSAMCFPWSIDMYRGEAMQPLAVAPRVMPEGTLPINGMPKMDLEQMTVSLHNPLKPTAQNLAHGKELFLTDCAPCHGDNGEGHGTVSHLLRHKPADLMTGVTRNLPEGYIYGYIRNGGIWMPSYDDAMSSNERWDVVMYVRSMQAKAAAEAKAAKAKK